MLGAPFLFNNGVFPIKSMQDAGLTVTTGNTSEAVTLGSAVDTANTIIIGSQALQYDATDFKGIACYWQLTSSTQITATKTNASGNSDPMEFTIIEFQPNIIKSIQYGNITLAAGVTSNTAAVSSYDTGNSFIIPCGAKMDSSSFSSGNAFPSQVRYTKTDSTTITLDVAANTLVTQDFTHKFCLVEFEGYF